jgi:hypothetical protein
MKIRLSQAVFEGQPPEVIVACVDYDGLLKFGSSINIHYTWASERWRGNKWIKMEPDSNFEPLTMIVRKRK